MRCGTRNMVRNINIAAFSKAYKSLINVSLILKICKALDSKQQIPEHEKKKELSAEAVENNDCQAKQSIDLEQVCTKFSEGDHKAFSILYEKYKNLINTIIISKNSNMQKSDVEDLIQQTFINAYNGRKGFKYESEPKAKSWFSAITHNVCKRHFEKSKRYNEIFDSSKSINAYTNYVPNNDGKLFNEENNLKIIEDCIDSIPKLYGEPLRLFLTGNWSHEKIAEHLGKKPKTIKRYCQIGLKELKSILPEKFK